MTKTILKICCIIFLCACGNKNTKKIVEVGLEKYPDSFEKGLKAHGGLDRWDSFGSLTFNEIKSAGTTKHIIDLKNRNERMEKEGVYKIGFTKDSISIYPNENSFPSKNPRYAHNKDFYFFAIQFVTADKGVNREELEPQELGGVLYNRIKITFGDNVGFAPKDQYILWYDQVSNLLKMVNYSVTYYDETEAEKYKLMVYTNWNEVNGLIIPVDMISYEWENNTLGKEHNRKSFDGIKFDTLRPDPNIFINLSK